MANPNSFNFGGQNHDPEIVRENFNKIARWLTAADACVLTLQSQSADISALGANAAIRTFTVFMRSDTAACDVTIPDPAIFDLSVIGKKDTIFFFKGLSGASTKTVNINSGTVEGASSFTLANDQTVCIQSDGTEYKILFDSSAMTGGSGDTDNFVESVTGYNVDNTHPLNPIILPVEVDGITITGSGTEADPFIASVSGSGDTADRFGLEDINTPSDRIVDLETLNMILNNVNQFTINDSSVNPILFIDNSGHYATLTQTDGIGSAGVIVTSSSGGGYTVFLTASDGINSIIANLDGSSGIATFLCITVKIQAGLRLQYTPVNSNYTVLPNDYTIDCFDTSGPGTFAVTLPPSSTIAGQVYVIKNSGTGTITIVADTGEGDLIDGAATKTLSVQYSSITLQASNSNSWAIIAKV